MTPDLALTLSFEGIGLLTRVPGGWHLLGEVTLDSPDLAADLADLRAQAVAVGGDDFRTTLVLPNDQIKYLTLPAGRMTEKKRRAQAEQALEAATPYKAGQLLFDLTMQGRTPQVAAVARDTLVEAEAFAVEHAFNPVNFTAMPPEDSFAKAPDFGLSQAASEASVKVKADDTAILVIGEGPLPDPIPETPEPVEPEQPAPAPEVAPVAEPAEIAESPATEPERAPQNVVPQAPVKAEAAADTPKKAPTEAVKAEIESKQPEPAQAIQEIAKPDDTPVGKPDAKPEAPTAFASIRAQKSTTAEKAPGLSGVTRKVSGTNAPSIPTDGAGSKAPPLRFDPSAAVAGLKSDTPSDSAEATNDDGAAAAPFASARSKTKIAGPAPKTSKNRSKKTNTKTAKSKERQKLAVFGSSQAEVRGKPRHLGLILTAILLVFLAAVALWASLTLEDGVAGLFGNDEPVQVADTPLEEAVADDTVEMAQPEEVAEAAPQLAESVPDEGVAATKAEQAAELSEGPIVVGLPDSIEATPEAAIDTVETALLEPLTADSITDSAEIEAMLDEVADGSIDPMEAEARYAVTGIWQRAPEQALDPHSDSSDDIYIASVDGDTIGFDAVALPSPEALETDLPARSQANPLAADVAFDFDDRGLVVATSEGAMNPDGVMVYLGRPAVFPAAYPKRIKVGEEPQLSAEDTTRLATLRPKLRPNDLIEKNERATLGGRTLAELAVMRPKLRPESAKQADELDRAPTQYAVKTSLRPRVKPANIAQLAARATPSETTTVVATPAAAAVVPDIPTTASVARQATIKNAINLNKVNLIGVYGTSSNRRALVRLSSGRYKKVQVGDRIDGGRVSAIGESELHYTKSGRQVTLKMPKG